MGVKNKGKLERDLLKELQEVTKIISRPMMEEVGVGIVEEMKTMIAVGISPIRGVGRFPEYKVKTKQRSAQDQIKRARVDRATTKQRQAEAKKVTKRTKLFAKAFKVLGRVTGSKAAKSRSKDISRRGKQSALKARLLASQSRRQQRGIGRQVAAKKEIRGYPYTVQKQFPNKKPRPVNLFLSGDFLRKLKHFVTGGEFNNAHLEIGFASSEDLANAMEDGHRTGWLGQGKRPIIPTGSEQFAERIRRVAEKIIGQFIAKKLRSKGR